MDKEDRRDLEFGLLRTFLAVAHHGSLGRTAAAMAMTQPAVSQQVSRLERIVGQALFERGRNGVKLTHHGELLVSYANRAIDLSEETLMRLRGDRPCECIRLAMSADVALMGIVPVLKRWQSAHRELKTKVVVTDPARLERMLQKGEVDLAIGEPASLGGMPIMEWSANLAWVAHPDFCVDRSRELPLILFEGLCLWQEELLDSLRGAGWQWRVLCESSSLDVIRAAVESGIGVSALLPRNVGNSGLKPVEHPALPSPPTIRFGIFRGNAAPSRARSTMEAELAMAFRIKQRDCEIADEALAFYEQAKNPESAGLTRGRLRIGQA
jgi:DNA-binding transcriptional LysR family regulator